MRKNLLSTNTPPPSRKSLQQVMAMIESVNEADMSHRCRQLVDVNTLRGGRDTLPAGDTDCVLIRLKCHQKISNYESGN